jgi:hypothetical protein
VAKASATSSQRPLTIWLEVAPSATRARYGRSAWSTPDGVPTPRASGVVSLNGNGGEFGLGRPDVNA